MTERLSLSSPVKFLANFYFDQPQALRRVGDDAALVLVCGARGAGKTTWCRELYEQARKRGLAVAGVLSPAVFSGATKTGIDLWDLGSGAHRRLAERRGPATQESFSSIATENWAFDPQVLIWGNTVLARQQADRPAAELLILDELGPLEFQRNQGLTAGLALIEARGFRLACMTLRPELLAQASERWPWAQVMHVEPRGARQ